MTLTQEQQDETVIFELLKLVEGAGDAGLSIRDTTQYRKGGFVPGIGETHWYTFNNLELQGLVSKRIMRIVGATEGMEHSVWLTDLGRIRLERLRIERATR
jgi:hypothetical protein